MTFTQAPDGSVSLDTPPRVPAPELTVLEVALGGAAAVLVLWLVPKLLQRLERLRED